MIRLDHTILANVGWSRLPVNLTNSTLKAVYSVLESRVGFRLASRMTDEQLNEFEVFVDEDDEAGALQWLETNFPDYKVVVHEELRSILDQLSRAGGWIAVVTVS